MSVSQLPIGLGSVIVVNLTLLLIQREAPEVGQATLPPSQQRNKESQAKAGEQKEKEQNAVKDRVKHQHLNCDGS